MNGSRVRGGEGRFITFYFIIFYTISFFILKKNTKVINLPSPTLTFLRAKEMKSYSYSLFDFTCSVSIMNTVYLLPFFPL